jgi:hypothetical protein
VKKVNEQLLENEKRRLVKAVQEACIRAALAGYEQAASDGLCHEGAWESAVGAMQMLNLDAVIRQFELKSSQDKK